MTRASRTLLWAPFIVAGVILAGWFVIWRAGADAMRNAISDFAASQRPSGAVFTYQPMRARGFPFFLRGELGAVSYGRGKWRWDSEAIYLHATPWSPNRIVVSTGPSIRLSEPGGMWTIKADSARASVEAAAGGWLFKAEAASLGGVKDDTSVATGRGVINIMPDSNDVGAYSVSFRLFDTTLENNRGETQIARLDGALIVDPDLRRVTIRGIDSEIGAARAQLSGAVAVDSEGFLEGTLAATLTNPSALAETLRVFGAVKSDDSRAIEAGLSLIAAGGGGKIAAPLVFSEGEAKLAGAKIGKAPKIGQP